MQEILRNISLKPYNTFGIDAAAKLFFDYSDPEALKNVLEAYPQEAVLPLGGGSNILLTKDFDGIVLRNSIKGISLIGEDEIYYYVKVGSGEIWHEFVLYCIRHNYAGVENLSLIPGRAGASPMQNIGAYGVEIKDVFHSLEAIHIRDLTLRTFNASDCKFGYRESVFKKELKGQYIILNVTYRLRKKPVFNISYGAIEQELDSMGITELSIGAISNAVINIRSRKLPDPKLIGNAGSFFKNPTISTAQYESVKKEFPQIHAFAVPGHPDQMKIAAGWMIEQCGWKGFRDKDAGVHAHQALVLVNYGHATGEEIFTLSSKIIDSVKERFGITLEREVNIL